MVEATGFEPTTLWSRTIRATNCATPQYKVYYIFKSCRRQTIFTQITRTTAVFLKLFLI